MKTMNMISRRSFLKAAMAASAVSALALTGCGGAASSTASTASGAAASSEAASSAVAGETFKVGIVNYVDHASLNQIVASVESRLDELGKEKGVTFDYADYYANAQADQSNLNQIGADLVADGVDVIVAVATPTAATMLAAVEDTEIPVVYSAVTDPAAAGFDGGENMTGTSDALNTAAIMNLILAADPEIDTIGLLYDLSQDSSTQAIADAKAFCDEKGILLLFDEVQCGMGRIGTRFAWQSFGVEPDAFSMAKAIANGLPMGGFITKRKYADTLTPGTHASTFGGTALVSAAALAVQEAFDNEGVLENCREQGEYLRRQLGELGKKYPFVKGVRGMGLMIGVVLDREAATLAGLCLKRNLVVLTAGETVLRLLPPLNLTRAEADEGIGKIAAALEELNAAIQEG